MSNKKKTVDSFVVQSHIFKNSDLQKRKEIEDKPQFLTCAPSTSGTFFLLSPSFFLF